MEENAQQQREDPDAADGVVFEGPVENDVGDVQFDAAPELQRELRREE